ncbi:S1 RNA-binding domain-containing protein [Patescibacteria group bacterium]|nr:S1 RNA-binding domain-containing protein [Patescibacteria group bacterium]
MADLMKSVKTNFVSPHKGESLEGTITKLTSAEIAVDIGAKTDAIVLEKDKNIAQSIFSQFKVGDKVKVNVLNPESEMGNPVVSLRRFLEERNWEKLDKLKNDKSLVDAKVVDLTKGGFILATEDGLSGFLPNSQASFVQTGQNPMGKILKVGVLELNRQLKKVIFSQKSSMTVHEFEEEARALKEGQVISCTITNVAPFGVFVAVSGKTSELEGLVHLSEISWERSEEVPGEYKPGEKIEAMVIGLDKKTNRVNLSVKRLIADPFEKEMEKFAAEKRITAVVSKIMDNGVVLDLGEGIEGFIKKEKIPPTVTYKEGATVTATVLEVDKQRHRVTLVPVLTEKPIGYR